MSKDYRGDWIKNPNLIDDGGEIETITIVKVDGSVCYAPNKTISKDDIDMFYVRPSEVMDDPYALKLNLPKDLLGEIDIQPKNEIFVEDKKPSVDESVYDPFNVKQETKQVVQKEPRSKEYLLIESLSSLGANSTITFETNVDLPLDISVVEALLKSSKDLNKEELLKYVVELNIDEIKNSLIKILLEKYS